VRNGAGGELDGSMARLSFQNKANYNILDKHLPVSAGLCQSPFLYRRIHLRG
jgi:hypothetical protein